MSGLHRHNEARALWDAARIAERRHAKGTFARTHSGLSCDERSPAARSFCALGALRVACAKQVGWGSVPGCALDWNTAARLEEALRQRTSTGVVTRRVAQWNDDDATTGADVARVMRDAIGRVGAPRRQ